MACMVEGQPIIDAYWKDVHGRKIISNWQFEVCVSSVIRQRFPFQNNSKNIGPSYKTDLDLWNYFAWENPIVYYKTSLD